MELRDLQIFVAVAEAGGFRRASQQLGLDASAVSRRVSMLEDELGVSLFERNRAGVRLTGAGRRFLTDTRLALSHLDGAVRTASAAGYAGEGMVKIGVVASVSSSFPNRLIRAFKADFPNVALDIVEGSYGEHLAALMERTLDVAFVMDSPKPPGCEVEGLWSEPILAALPADDPRCARGVLDIQDMAADLFIVSQAAPGPHVHDFIVQRLASLGFTPRINQHRVGREGLAPTRIDALIRALRLLIDDGARGVADASLGTANLIFLALKSLELDRLVLDGERDHTFLAVEEPEAHLHPQVQRLVYRHFLAEPDEPAEDDEEEDGAAEARGPSRTTTILTTHSPHIASIAPLRSIVLLRRGGEDGDRTLGVSTAETPLTAADEADLQRYIDVTRGELFFARGIILVEGDAERFLVPAFAEALDMPLDRLGITVCAIGGINFAPYVKLLGPSGVAIPHVNRRQPASALNAPKLLRRCSSRSASSPRRSAGFGSKAFSMNCSPRTTSHRATHSVSWASRSTAAFAWMVRLIWWKPNGTGRRSGSQT